jgi:hypothetical protein
MRVNGRTLRPSTLAERRLLLSFGVESLRVPRRLNPYTVARRIRRLARGDTPEHLFLRELVDAGKKKMSEDIPTPSPDLDLPEPIELPPMVTTHDQAA